MIMCVGSANRSEPKADGLIKIVIRNAEPIEGKSGNKGFTGVVTARLQEFERLDSPCFVIRDPNHGLLIAIPSEDGDVAKLATNKNQLFQIMSNDQQIADLLKRARDN